MSQIMRGGQALRAIMDGFFEATMPNAIDVAREQWSLEDWQLPYPQKYDMTDITMSANGEFPTLGSTTINARRFNRIDVGPEAELQIRPRYSCRIIIVALTGLDDEGNWEDDGRNSAIRICDDLTSLAINCMLQTPSFASQNGIARMDETSILMDKMEPNQTKTQSDRWVAASLVTVEVELLETTYAVKYGNANTVTPVINKLIP